MNHVRPTVNSDTSTLQKLGYTQELDRRMSGFSNFALSFSIICILSGGLTSFHLGFSAVGGAAIGIGWPLSCSFSLIVAAAMGQLASAFPTAGGLYHWAAILGGRALGWVTAWFNVAGLITALAAINVGTFNFAVGTLGKITGLGWDQLGGDQQFWIQAVSVALITVSQGFINHRGIKLTTKLTDISGYLLLVVTVALTLSMLWVARDIDLARLVKVENFSGSRGGGVWPANDNTLELFALGLLLPAYTITGFDASAHTSEETIEAQNNVPRGIVRSVLVSSVAGWILLMSLVLAMPSMDAAAAQGGNVFFWLLASVLPGTIGNSLLVAIVVAQYLCGLATVTSASRMTYAFARDGGLPFSGHLKVVSSRSMSPARAIWTVVALAIAFTIYTPVYSTITVCCVIFLYLSYVLPLAIAMYAHHRYWKKFGPWTLGRWFKPACMTSVLGGLALIVIGIQPPNDKALFVLVGGIIIMLLVWFGIERRRFKGPPVAILDHLRDDEA